MSGGELAAIGTALAAILVGIAQIILSLRKVHFLVNSHKVSLENRIDQLTAALKEQGADVPPREDA